MDEKKESIRPFVQGQAIVLSQNTSLSTAARTMREQAVGSVVVSSNDGEIVGILTDRDIACRGMAFALNPERAIQEIMTKTPALITEQDSVESAAQLMEQYGIRRIPVIEAEKSRRVRCVGMVSLDDLVVSQAVPLSTISQVVRAQIRRRSRSARSERRAEERKEQSLQRFFKTVAGHMGVEEDQAEPIIRTLLQNVVRRLPYTSAAHLVAQFPQKLQEDLLDLPSGPDRSITAKSLVQDLSRRFQKDESEIRELTSQLWRGVEEFTHNQGPDKALGQLPKDMQEIFFEAGTPSSLPTGDADYRSEQG